MPFCAIFTPEIAITPDVQLLINSVLNPEEDAIWVFGLRARLGLKTGCRIRDASQWMHRILVGRRD